jgi:hypothetical protein
MKQVRKRGLPPHSQQRGQATLPDLFYFLIRSFIFYLLFTEVRRFEALPA